MLNEVKKNLRVSAKDLSKSLEHANISVDESTIRKTLNKKDVHGRTPRKKPLLSKKNIAAHCWSSQKSIWMFHSNTGKIFCGQMKLKLCCLEGTHNATVYVEKKRHKIPTSKPHPNCKVWWREHHGLGLLYCLRAWTACYHRRKNVFPSLSRHFAGECKAICPPIEAQQKLGDATGQRPIRQK